ncbi:hypothetical protein AAFF_G00389690 [Aldrovandia affinis]|uniref:PH domain-containing protein n=1 Tax=Aldrovandia affinis TaxID=143900 RepID=A0AAD7SEA5_9TELE|nr:hypothetical protein AAFF_G00389690 [Aldrovandia affinis]
MDKQKVLNRLVSDLQSFLLVLDSENLSYIAQAQKKSISDLLTKLQDTPVEDAEYMIMNCPSGATSSDLRDKQSSDTGAPPPGTADLNHVEEPSSSSSAEWLLKGNLGPAVPPHPSEDEDCYEEAEPFIPPSQPTADAVDSGSSHYESYGEEEEEEEEEVKDRAHYIQWSASQPCLRPVPESRVCGYLWRKRWLGQWVKQLFIIRNNLLLCYKCAKDLNPLLEVRLRGCTVVYKFKQSNKMQHELKVAAGSDTLVLGFQTRLQADDWRKVIEEVSGSTCYEKESHSSSSLLKCDRLTLKCDRLDSCRSSAVLHTDSDEDKLSGLPSALSSVEIKDKGLLNVLMNCQWQSLWCQVEDGALKMFGDEVCEESPQYSVQLRGCEVRPGPDTAQAYRITVAQHGDQVAVLEASCADEKEHWVQLLQDGSASQADPLYERLDATLDTGELSGLMTRRFPTSNMYIDDPFHQLCGAGHSQPIYSNSSVMEDMFQKSRNVSQGESAISKEIYCNNEVFVNHSRKTTGDPERGVQKLDLIGRRRVQLRAGSEVNLATAGKPAKRTSFRQSLAFCADRAQGGFLTPLLRRTASAKNSLKRAPSALFIEKGKVFQKRKEWETKASA